MGCRSKFDESTLMLSAMLSLSKAFFYEGCQISQIAILMSFSFFACLIYILDVGYIY